MYKKYLILVLLFSVFLLSPVPTHAGFEILHNFTGGTTNGDTPWGAPAISGSTLYGMTYLGGANGMGTIYSVGTNGSGFTILKSFEGATTGSYPEEGNSVIVSSGKLYGMTTYGGSSSKGVVFSMDTDGNNFTVLHHFVGGGGDGAYPQGDLVLSGSTLYGMTSYGGDSNEGVIFSISTDGNNFTLLHEFNGGVNDGGFPYSTLIVSGSKLYGVTPNGGDTNDGVIFSMDTDGNNFTLLHEFNRSVDGENPYKGPILIGDTLYGGTYTGGTYDDGTVYSIKTDGSDFTVLKHCQGLGYINEPDQCKYIRGRLAYDDGILYGMSEYGGVNVAGNIFRITLDTSAFSTIHSFKGSDISNGVYPYNNSLTYNNDVLYGTTQDGGTSNKGVLFAYTLDKVAPSISLTAVVDPTSDATPTLTGTATDAEGTVTAVQYQVDSTAGSWTACTAGDGTFDEASEAFTCTVGTALSDGEHTIYVRATDDSSNTTAGGSESSDTFTVDATAPVISSATLSTKTDTTFTISWTTNEASSSQIEYGETASYGSTNTETDTTTRVTSHTSTASGLTPCTTYYYRSVSRDAAENTGYSDQKTVRTNGCASTTSSSQTSTKTPDLPTTAAGTNQSGILQTARGNAQGQGYIVTTILEENTFDFGANLYNNTTSNTTFSLTNPTSSVSSVPLSLPTPQGTYFQMGTNIQEIWYDASTTDGLAKIIPELQRKPSIISLSYQDIQLFTPGAGWFPEASLVLAHSIDGITWTILPTSVVDTENNTVAALHKVGGYYTIMMRMGGGYYQQSGVLGAQSKYGGNVGEDTLDTGKNKEQNQEQEKNIGTKRNKETNQQQETNNQQAQPQYQNKSILQRFVGWVRSLF